MSLIGWTFIVIGLFLAFVAWACVFVGADYEHMDERQKREHKEDKR